MKDPTNKELLEIILKQTNSNAIENANFAGRVSTFMNEQRDFNTLQIRLNDKFEGYFESNPKTNQKGFIEQTQENVKDINNLKNQYKIAIGFSVVLGYLSGYVSNFFNK
jgi:hypothetical protein|tara:strand:+ start:18 stop:344 length:327 start_codon:yes stop_codon:yes gene_type:complete